GRRRRHACAARARPEHLRRLLRVRDREVELRRALLLGSRDRRVGAARPRPLDRLTSLRLRPAARCAAPRPAARPAGGSGRLAGAAARVRHDGGPRRDDRRQLLLPHDPVLLLLRLPRLRARPACRVRRPCAPTSIGAMKGVILAGGSGSRLAPLTRITNKHLLPLYHRPMVTYAVESLVEAGFSELMLVTGGTHAGEFFRLLGNGHEYGIERLFYA